MTKTQRRAFSPLVATLLLSAFAMQSNPGSAQTGADPAHEILPLFASGPRAFAMLTLGDGPPTPVVFDTGTDHNLLTENYAKKLKLTIVGSAPVTDAASGKSSTSGSGIASATATQRDRGFARNGTGPSIRRTRHGGHLWPGELFRKIGHDGARAKSVENVSTGFGAGAGAGAPTPYRDGIAVSRNHGRRSFGER